MAKVGKNVVVRGISGSVGDLVFRQMRDGSTRVSAMPDFSRRKFSKGQKDHQRRFKEAAAYARDAAKKYPIYAELTKGTTKNAYNVALSDWFNPPVIHRIERKGGQIWIEASDDVMVTKIQVKILDNEGRLLESGIAIQVEPADNARLWIYHSQKEGKIIAQAWDLAGNKTELTA